MDEHWCKECGCSLDSLGNCNWCFAMDGRKAEKVKPPLHLDEDHELILNVSAANDLQRTEACLDKFKTIDFKYLVDNQICLGEVILERRKEGKSVYCLQKLREVVEILLEAKKELDGK